MEKLIFYLQDTLKRPITFEDLVNMLIPEVDQAENQKILKEIEGKDDDFRNELF